METILDINSLIDRLLRDNVTPEELVNRAIRKYLIESCFMSPNMISIRNSVRATITFSKVLYDFGQQMSLARLYLVHRVKLLEVRDSDRCAEISVLRGLSPPLGRKSVVQ